MAEPERTRDQMWRDVQDAQLDAYQELPSRVASALPTAGWMGGLMAPSSGLTDYFGMYPQMPSEGEIISTEKLPSFSENIRNKRYADAGYQTLGLLGDLAYASAPLTNVAGLIAGTALKGASIAGKAGKFKGIASLSEKQEIAEAAALAARQKQNEQISKFAADNDSGTDNFVSPTIETLITKAPKNLKGNQINQWLNANVSKGVKPKELEYLGVDEFINANPNATLDEVIEGISGNKIKIRKNVYGSDESPAMEFLETIPDTDPLDGSNFWQHTTDDYLYALEKGESQIKRDLLDHYNEAWDVNKKSWDEVPKTMHEEIADSLAKQDYRDNPYEMIEAVDAGDYTFALGNEDVGYSIFVDGKRIEKAYLQGQESDPTPYSNTEARIQLRQAMVDEGYDSFRLEGVNDAEYGIYDNIQYKEYIDGNLPGGKNYREVVFNWENAPKGVGSFDHFEDENQIAHALVRDRKLADGTDSLHIDELQSDLHKEGSRYGYELTPKQIKNQAESINDSLKDTSWSFEQTGTMFGIKKPNPNVGYTFVDGHDFIDDHLIERALHDINSAIKIRKKEKTGKSTILGIRGPSGTESVKSFDYVDKLLDKSGNIKSQDEINKLYIDFSSQELNDYNLYKESYDLIRDIGLDKTKEISAKLKAINNQSAVPNYPFKDDWYNMGIKSLLMDAVDEGKDAISISTSAIMKDRYSSQYHKFYEMLYDKKIPSSMKKIANKYGGEFRKGSLDMNDTFLDSGIPKTDKGLYDANTIKITPKMREKILQEGVQTFASGGVIGNLPSRVAKI